MERLVANIETALSPGALVAHNLKLPVTGRKRSRQCDVVIRYGPSHQHIAIVEVQKRKRKPDINTFHGWVMKMQEVGAQKLFCVSVLGYPKSVVEEVATKWGPNVRLLTLRDIEDGNHLSGFFLHDQLVHTNPQFSLKEIGAIAFESQTSLGHFEIQTNQRVFSFGVDSASISLDELVCQVLNSSPEAKPIDRPDLLIQTRSVTIRFGPECDLWLNIDGNRAKVKDWVLRVDVTATRSTIPIPVAHLAYSRELVGDTMAWVAKTRIPLDGRDQDVVIVFSPDSEGFLTKVRCFPA